tara:strand:- start:314 stop:442 length:129 start_codon:yes stop_codon:yes gene_type:complete
LLLFGGKGFFPPEPKFGHIFKALKTKAKKLHALKFLILFTIS